MKTYSEVIKMEEFSERFEYLKLSAAVGQMTFNGRRVLNQNFYRSREWTRVRDHVISRDRGCDLGIREFPVTDRIVIHHIEPVTIDMLVKYEELLLDPENLIVCSHRTHNALHFGNTNYSPYVFQERKIGDTKLW